MIWRRRGRKIVRIHSIVRVRDAALAALVSLGAFSAHAAPAAPLTLAAAGASDSAATSLSSTLRSLRAQGSFAASTTATAHRLRLPDGPPLELRLSTLEATLELRTRAGTPLHARLPLFSTPCHPIDPGSDEVLLQCDSGRIDAAIAVVKGHRYLDIRELRGLPTDEGEEGPPQLAYAPELFGATGPCPGDTDAARGECFYAAHQDAKAEAAFQLAVQRDETRSFAALRLGDLALRRRDPDRALVEYLQAGSEGIWGRLASERLCELTGSCFDGGLTSTFDSTGLPDRIRTELALREARLLLLLGRWSDAMEQLSLQMDTDEGSCIGDTNPLCRRMILAALRTPACPREAALSSYLRLAGFLMGPLAPELARAAGQDAGELGAPAYGAALLSATARLSAQADLLAHAREAISLYLAAGDPYRARVMWSWASTRLPARAMRELPADQLGAPASAPAATSPLTAASADLESDEGAAALAVARSTMLRSSQIVPPPPPARSRR